MWVPLFTKSEYEDTHGGFHGDGDSIDKVYLNDFQADILLWQINKNPNWRKIPVEVKLYDTITYALRESNIKIPNIQRGYWFFKDRHTDAINVYDEFGVFSESRYSVNFSVGIYDSDRNILYFYESDS